MIVVAEDCEITASTVPGTIGGAGASGINGFYPAGAILPNQITGITLGYGKIFIY
jgi:hypothetical protein